MRENQRFWLLVAILEADALGLGPLNPFLQSGWSGLGAANQG